MAEVARRCGQCGAENPAGNNYCGRCGSFLSARGAAGGEGWRPADRAGEPRARAQSHAILIIAALFVLTCVMLSLIVIVWRP